MENRSNANEPERTAPSKQAEPAISFKSVNWGRLFGYLKPYRGRMALAILALLLSSGFGLAFPLVIVRLLDSVTKAKSFAPLNNLAFLLVGIFLLQAAFSFFQSYLLAYIGEHIVYDLRTLFIQPPAEPLARLLCQPARRRYCLAPLQRRDPDAHHADQQPHHAAQPDRSRWSARS